VDEEDYSDADWDELIHGRREAVGFTLADLPVIVITLALLALVIALAWYLQTIWVYVAAGLVACYWVGRDG